MQSFPYSQAAINRTTEQCEEAVKSQDHLSHREQINPKGVFLQEIWELFQRLHYNIDQHLKGWGIALLKRKEYLSGICLFFSPHIVNGFQFSVVADCFIESDQVVCAGRSVYLFFFYTGTEDCMAWPSSLNRSWYSLNLEILKKSKWIIVLCDIRAVKERSVQWCILEGTQAKECLLNGKSEMIDVEQSVGTWVNGTYAWTQTLNWCLKIKGPSITPHLETETLPDRLWERFSMVCHALFLSWTPGSFRRHRGDK